METELKHVRKMSTSELAASYAALILADDGIDITARQDCIPHLETNILIDFQADKLNTLIKAAGVPDVEPIWATLFAKVSKIATSSNFHLRSDTNGRH